MACPSLSVRLIQIHLVQTATGVSFEISHDSLRRNLGFPHRVHVIASHVGRNETPGTMHAHPLNRFQYRIAAWLVQMIRSLIHKLCLESGPPGIYLQDRGSRRIVPAVDGAGFPAMQMASLASEGD